MNFKVGDRVRVKTNLQGGERYGDMYFNADMEIYRGKEYTITAINKYDYYLEGVRTPFLSWSWNDEMLEPAILRDWALIVRPSKDDPDKTVAILKVGGKETRHESVKRYHKDEYDIEAAIKAVMAKVGCVDAKPPVTVEPPKPEPVIIGGRELKVGSKFILKPYSQVENHRCIDETTWNNMFSKVLVCMSPKTSGGSVEANNLIYYERSAIDRILED